jgi:hypothetical protein
MLKTFLDPPFRFFFWKRLFVSSHPLRHSETENFARIRLKVSVEIRRKKGERREIHEFITINAFSVINYRGV